MQNLFPGRWSFKLVSGTWFRTWKVEFYNYGELKIWKSRNGRNVKGLEVWLDVVMCLLDIYGARKTKLGKPILGRAGGGVLSKMLKKEKFKWKCKKVITIYFSLLDNFDVFILAVFLNSNLKPVGRKKLFFYWFFFPALNRNVCNNNFFFGRKVVVNTENKLGFFPADWEFWTTFLFFSFLFRKERCTLESVSS